jgi:lactoylglutathione lyase
MLKLGFVILYTRDVAKKIAFYERAFGVKKKSIVGDGIYGEVEGPPPLGFASEDFIGGSGHAFAPTRAEGQAPGFEIGFIVDDVAAAYARAVEAGCTPVSPPETKPWGQVVSYVRDDDGVYVEICSPWSLDAVPE